MLTFAKSQTLGILLSSSSSRTVTSSSTHPMGRSSLTTTRRAFSTWLGAASVVETTNSPYFSLAKDFVTHPTAQTIGILAAYIVTANLLYLARRGYLRNMTMRQLWKIRTTREDGVRPPLFGGMLLAWQFLVLLFPVAEPLAKILTKGCIFFYSYPKAQGGGYIWEPLGLPAFGSQSARQTTGPSRLAQICLQYGPRRPRWISTSSGEASQFAPYRHSQMASETLAVEAESPWWWCDPGPAKTTAAAAAAAAAASRRGIVVVGAYRTCFQ